MLYHKDSGFIFLHDRKTAGMSVAKALSKSAIDYSIVTPIGELGSRWFWGHNYSSINIKWSSMLKSIVLLGRDFFSQHQEHRLNGFFGVKRFISAKNLSRHSTITDLINFYPNLGLESLNIMFVMRDLTEQYHSLVRYHNRSLKVASIRRNKRVSVSQFIYEMQKFYIFPGNSKLFILDFGNIDSAYSEFVVYAKNKWHLEFEPILEKDNINTDISQDIILTSEEKNLLFQAEKWRERHLKMHDVTIFG